MKARVLAACLAAAFPPAASAVYLNPDGLGQALVYPYYTAQSAGGNPFNTYLSVVNHAADAKAVRVRVREGRNGAQVLSFNLFLSPNDMWTGAIVPSGVGAALVSADRSCVDLDGQSSMNFGNALYAGAIGDGLGDGLDRTREGYVEMLEMGTLGGAAAQAVAHNSAGNPANCAAIKGVANVAPGAPTGGLSGTLTLINVANGEDFTVNADALDDLAAQSYFRLPADPYPAFDAAEITPVSVVNTGGQVYRSQWSRGVDAVSAVFMRSEWQGEYVLDAGTRSKTDFIVTLPTRHYYVRADGADPPFTRPRAWKESCAQTGFMSPGEDVLITHFNREQADAVSAGSTPSPGGERTTNICSSSAVYSPRNGSAHMGTGPTSGVTGSINAVVFSIVSTFENGWLTGRPRNFFGINSLSTSSRMQRDGAVTSGAHAFNGLPMTGFALRTFENGTLLCGSAACQGNYGGAFPLKYKRRITPSD